VAFQLPHSYVIEPLGRRPGWFKHPQYRYYCIRCHWMFLVDGRKIHALNESCDSLLEPENSHRVASFALGPCVAIPPKCSWMGPEINATSAYRKTTVGLSSTGGSGQSPISWLKPIPFANPKVVYLRSRTQSSRQQPKKLRKSR
jgi:hypothetical protein